MPAKHKKWVVCVFLLLATTLLYLDRQALALLAPVIRQELRLNNADFGTVLAVFYYAYTIAQFLIGMLLDRANLRWAYGAGVLLWSGAVFLTGTSTGLAGLLAFRTLLGFAESVNWPGAMRIVARTLPPEERALGNGIFTSGTSIGALIAPVLIVGIASQYGWRASFHAVAAAGAAWFAGWLILTRGEAMKHTWRAAPAEAAARVPAPRAYGEIFRTAQFWRVFAVTVLVNPCLYFNLNWIPTYFDQHRGLPPSGQRWILTLIYLGLDLGYLFCGSAVLWLTRRGTPLPAARRNVFLLASLCLGAAGVVPLISGLNAAVAVLVAVNFGAGVWIAMYLTMAQEVSHAYVSTAAGLLGGSGSLAGAFLMRMVGVVTHETNSFAIPMLGVTVAAVLAAAAGLAVVRGSKAAVPAQALQR
jgi:ACS family hexuronate transporter-like MFS transporter